MPYIAREWLNLSIRWFHVFAGIMWIGQTYFFTWLDHRFSEEKQVWMVHSGGFYVVEKQKVPEMLPGTLHWFKWEAALTWLSGVSLLFLVYYNGKLMNDPDVWNVSNAKATAVSVAFLVAAWLIYDLLWVSPIARQELVGVVLSYALLVGAIYLSTRLFSHRAAYMQIGAVMGTLMAANVWMRILPAQRQLIAATKAGTQPDMGLASVARQRSKHNTFMVIPVVFIMISNHFPVATYGHDHAWILLAALVLVGWGVAQLIRTH